MNESNKKRLKNTGLATLAASMLITGSLAWRDVSQHKTNKFKTQSVTQSMVLVEKFKETNTWKKGQTVAKQVYVRNGQDTDDTDQFIYSDGFVRVQLREFIGTGSSTPKNSEERYLIDTKGNYIKGQNQDEAYENAKAIWPGVEKTTIKQVETEMDSGNGAPDGGYWYVPTNEKAPNGIYGKKINLGPSKSSQFTSVEDSSVKVSETDLDKDQKDSHNNNTVLEDGDQYFSARTGANSVARNKYVQLNYGDDHVSLADWKAQGKNTGPFWIIDENTGWAYWAQSIYHGRVGSIENHTMTSDLLKSVKLNYTGGDQLIYRLHVDMDAVSSDEIKNWNDADSDLKTALESFTPGEQFDIDNKALYDKYYETRDETIMLKSAHNPIVNKYAKGMNSAYKALNNKDYVGFAKNMDTVMEYQPLAKSEPQSTTVYDTVYFADNNHHAREYWYLGDADKNGTKILMMTFQDNDETENLKNEFSENLADYSTASEGYYWRILPTSEVNSGVTYKQTGYEGSLMKKVSDERYKYNLQGNKFEKYVMSLNVPTDEELALSSIEAAGRTENFTSVDKKGNAKVAIPSVADFNHYNINVSDWVNYRENVQGVKTPVLRSYTRSIGTLNNTLMLWGQQYLGDETKPFFNASVPGWSITVNPIIMVNTK